MTTPAWNVSHLQDAASTAGIHIDIQPIPGGTRFAWRMPLAPGHRASATPVSTAPRPAPGGHERPASTSDRAALLQERLAHTVRALQATAAEAAALLEQQADLTKRPARMDYPTEIKRWRAFADQAEQMAKHWEQPP